MNKEAETKKYNGFVLNWSKAIEQIMEAEKNYALHVFEVAGDVTKKEAQCEFWDRVAEFYGFTITRTK